MDGLTVFALVNHWNERLTFSRIDKIHQPSSEDVVLTLRGRAGVARMLISVNRAQPRMHVMTLRGQENPPTPPMFCILLRKRLEGGRILQFRQQGFDRAVEVLIEHVDELGDVLRYVLVVELMGKHSNLILCTEGTNGFPDRVIDSIRHVTSEMSRVRTIFPGVGYTPAPPQGKPSAFELNPNTFAHVDWTTLTTKEQHLQVIRSVDGFGPVSAKEVLYRAVDGDVAAQIRTLVTDIARQQEQPSVCLDELGRPIVAAPFKMTSCPRYQVVPDLDEALEVVYQETATSLRRSSLAAEIEQSIDTHLDRLKGKLHRLLDLQTDSAAHDQLRICGELLTAYAYKVEKGASSVTLENFYDDDKPLVIALNPALSAIENAQRYFKQSSKRKRSIAILESERCQTEGDIAYLEDVRAHVESATTANLQHIRSELVQQGFMKEVLAKRKQKKQEQPALPDVFYSADGFVIRVGRNSAQNDRLTLRQSQGHDIWLHVKDGPGSHVVIRTEGQEVPPRTLHQAAMLAAYFSKAKDSTNVPVDYTEIRSVWKANGARPGQVLYEGHKTQYVTPRRDEIESILAQQRQS